MKRFDQNTQEIFVVDLNDLIHNKVEFLTGQFSIFFDKEEVIGLYCYDNFVVNCIYTIRRVANSFLVNLNISVPLPVYCDLCLNKFEYDFNLSVEEIFSTSFEYTGKSEDLYYFIFDGKHIDVGRVCVENFISNLPSKIVDNCKRK